jgi:hypothetical protein
MSLRAYLLGVIVLATVGFVVGTTIERNSGESRHESAATHRAEGKSAGTGAESKSTLAAEAAGTSTRTRTAPTGPQSKAAHATGESKAVHAAEIGGKTTSESGGESQATHAAETRTTHTESARNRTTTHTQTGGERKPTQGAQTSGRASTNTDTKRHAELKPLGVNVEAVPFVVLAAVASIVLALAAWFRPRMVLLLLAIAGAMLVFALLDVREVFHQSDESRTGLAVLAAVIATLHASAVVVAGMMARGARSL